MGCALPFSQVETTHERKFNAHHTVWEGFLKTAMEFKRKKNSIEEGKRRTENSQCHILGKNSRSGTSLSFLC